MLRIKYLHVYVDDKPILKGVDLTVRPGEIHAIMGPNGSGKSTLAYALMGHPRYKVGNPKHEIRNSKQIQNTEISLNGKTLLGKTPDQRARMGLFLAFQYPVSIDGVSIEQLLRQTVMGRQPSVPLRALEFRKTLVAEASRLGIHKDLLLRSVNDGFSGGEKKRVEILQLSMLRPKYAILDETDSGLDIDALRVVAEGINSISCRNTQIGIVLITHYQRILHFIEPDFVHIMVNGQIVKSGGKQLAAEIERKGYRKFLISH